MTIRITAQDGAPHPYFDIRAVFLADPQIIRKLVSEQRLFDDELIAAIGAFFGVETLFPFIKVEHTRYGLGIPEQAGAVGVDPQRPLFQGTVPETDLRLPFGHGAHRRQIGHRAGSDLKLPCDADRPAFGVPFQYKQPFSDKKVFDRIRRLQKAPVPADNAFTQPSGICSKNAAIVAGLSPSDKPKANLVPLLKKSRSEGICHSQSFSVESRGIEGEKAIGSVWIMCVLSRMTNWT